MTENTEVAEPPPAITRTGEEEEETVEEFTPEPGATDGADISAAMENLEIAERLPAAIPQAEEEPELDREALYEAIAAEAPKQEAKAKEPPPLFKPEPQEEILDLIYPDWESQGGTTTEGLIEAQAGTPSEESPAPKKRGLFWLGLLGAIVLVGGLTGQGLYFFRSDLAARYPAFKPVLQQFCNLLQCSIRLPANPDLLSIEASSLEADPEQSSLITLNAILRNRAKLPQEYPQLELTLTDTQDQMVARRIFSPQEYAKDADLSRGMPPNEELTVKLYLDLGDISAAGYRVFLFYPR
ncbi:MAG: DUF3426 domain-containing protein [Sulfuricella sp.]